MWAAQDLHVNLVGDVHVLGVIAEPGHHAEALGANPRLADHFEIGSRQLRTRVGERGRLLPSALEGGVLSRYGLGNFGAAHSESREILTREDRRPLLNRQLSRVGVIRRDPQQIHIDWHMSLPDYLTG